MDRVAIHGREVSEDVAIYIDQVISFLKEKGISISVSDSFGSSKYESSFQGLPRFSTIEHNKQFDCVLSLGGDGTFLETLTYVGEKEIPIMGINTGRLGFLAPISRDSINEALSKLINGQFEYEERSLVSLTTENDLFDGKNFALNEFAIIRKDTSSMVVIKCFINGDYLATYWADGLMVATPTGSTGYSLSCGGPIIMPQSGNFIITPVSPHNLNVRPLVLSDECTLTFEITSREANFLISLDSRSAAASEDIKIEIRKAPFVAKMIRIDGYSFIETLRTKLSWGLDKRN